MMQVALALRHLIGLGLPVLLASCGSSTTDGVALDTTVTLEEGAHVAYKFSAGTWYASISSDRQGVTVVWPCGVAPETKSYGAPCYFPQEDFLRIYNPVNQAAGGPETVHVLVIRK